MIVNLIGDIHADFNTYKKIIDNSLYSIQLGDFGFSNTWSKLNQFNVNPQYHKVLPGNHDDYSWIEYNKPLHNLGNFGTITLNNTNFYYVRGGNSIDKNQRIQGKDWWTQEIMSYSQMNECVNDYKLKSPDIVLSHSNPHSVIQYFLKKTNYLRDPLSQLLDFLIESHKPKLWIFGHLHPKQTTAIIINNTCFACLAIGSYISYDLNQSVDYNTNNIYQQFNND